MDTAAGIYINVDKINKIISYCTDLMDSVLEHDPDQQQLYGATNVLNLLGIHIPGINAMELHDRASGESKDTKPFNKREYNKFKIMRGVTFDVIDLDRSYYNLATELNAPFECIDLGDGKMKITFNPLSKQQPLHSIEKCNLCDVKNRLIHVMKDMAGSE